MISVLAAPSVLNVFPFLVSLSLPLVDFRNQNCKSRKRSRLPLRCSAVDEYMKNVGFRQQETLSSTQHGLENDRYNFRDFYNIYSGDFCNDQQLAIEPEVQFARKLHIPIQMSALGPHCFFVKEETRRGGRTQYRLRVAVFALVQKTSEEIVFRGKHYDFKDPSPLESDLSEDQYIAHAQVSFSHTFTASGQAV